MSGCRTVYLLAALLLSACSTARGPGGDGDAPAPEAGNRDVLTIAVGGEPAVFRRIDPARHGIRYPAFYMLETEVTNAQYAAFLAATGGSKDDGAVLEIVRARDSGELGTSTASVGYSVGDETGLWRHNRYPPGRADHPVALVRLTDAQAFCAWLNRYRPGRGLFRLPTWNEWMIAAYGRERSYPWGERWQPERMHSSYGLGWDERKVRAEPVRARPQGRTPEGLYGMLGNVAEYICEEDPQGGDYFALGSRWMGGSFESGDLWNTAAVLPPRKDYWGYSHHATNREADLGFRVVLDPQADTTLLQRARLFDQNDRSWMCEPSQSTPPGED